MSSRKEIDLICFDVDGTLVKHPSGMVIWEVLNLRYGGSQKVNRQRYDMYHRGDITYPEWVALDVQEWKSAGATRDEIVDSIAEFSLIDGAKAVVTELKRRGYKLAVISGTLDIVLEELFGDHPFDDVYTNQLFFDAEGRLEDWRATPYDGRGKPEALREIAKRHRIPLSRSAFIGDGENDVPLLGLPGLFVAYRPRSQKLEAGADVVIKEGGLEQLLEIIEKRK